MKRWSVCFFIFPDHWNDLWLNESLCGLWQRNYFMKEASMSGNAPTPNGGQNKVSNDGID